ncbi:MAG: S10 family peptidase [Parachlamydiaceae bacterium]
MSRWFVCSFFLIFACFASEEAPPLQCPFNEVFSETSHSVNIQGQPINYKATAGNLILKDCKANKDSASIFFVAYTKEDVIDKGSRPITFCFNGGPGSASVWLNIGVFGPRIIKFSDENALVPPYHLVDNPESLLDLTDLVFIDPVSVGHSTPAPGVDPKTFYGVDEDVKTFAEFIRLYLSRYKRWNSPKYIAGESYGTTRAGSLSDTLQDDYHIYLNGVILVSSIMDFHTKDPSSTNDLPYMLFLPTYTATAWYHKKLPESTKGDLRDVLSEAEEFAMNRYALALLKGDTLKKEERSAVIAKLAELTGLKPEYIDSNDLRIHPMRFTKELLRNEHKVVGRFDSRYTGLEIDQGFSYATSDPSFNAILGAFTGIFNDYLTRELKWNNENQYFVLADVLSSWNWGRSNRYLNTSDNLAKALIKNPNLKVFVASGYYDLATPYYATVFTFDHLGLDPSLRERLFMYEYEGGHMMYLSRPILAQMRRDLEYFYNIK